MESNARNEYAEMEVIGPKRQLPQSARHAAHHRDICLIKHDDDDHFILNMGGFHSFVRICRVLPASLTDVEPLIKDRVAFHKTASAKAQRARRNQRKRTAARKQETAQAKKWEAELAAAEADAADRASTRPLNGTAIKKMAVKKTAVLLDGTGIPVPSEGS
ncbi:hypothetical protein DFH08DRAFT_1034003 [Mycena albidolilacea]|uniref:Uncharacterized protein n=1 Tax=Mycena albidolilacea TaxID=1033008 RepID=A0AAD7EHG1_9AGAR|nr:hypothetical protein DFH08DRAFT_1034003 [Mycena albidolilacea]